MSDFQSFFGNPDVTTYDECLKIFDFAEMTSDDIFYDLGCGYGTVCIVAAQKYSPKKIIGIEARYENFLEATNRILEKNLEKKIILKNEFVENINFSEATLIYYSIKPNLNHLLHLSKMMKKNCRIVTPKIPLPSIKPKTYPMGYEVEVIKFSALQKAEKMTKDSEDREHVTLFIMRKPKLFSRYNVNAPTSYNKPKIRVCVDTKDDFLVVQKIFSEKKSSKKLYFYSSSN